MPWFEDFSPEKSETLPLPDGFLIRPVLPSDADEIARIRVEREEREYERLIIEVNDLLKEYEDVETTQVFVAEADGIVIGFTIMRYFTPADDAPVNSAPAGWYLLGINVRKAFRRRGVGTELVRARLKFIPDEFDTAYYFTNTKNFTSQAFHSRFGFTEIKEDIVFPKRKFTTIYYKIDLIELRKRNFELE